MRSYFRFRNPKTILSIRGFT